MTSKCKKSQIWPWKITFRVIQPNLSFDMWFMSPKRSFMPKKKKSYWSVSEINPSPPPSILTDGRTDGRTDGQTDRQTTDKSVLEKLRCLSAGGAKNDNAVDKNPPQKSTKIIYRITRETHSDRGDVKTCMCERYDDNKSLVWSILKPLITNSRI